MNDIKGDYIRIPNVVTNNKNLKPSAKLLYGYIWYWSFYGEVDKTTNDICDVLGCTYNSAIKYIRALEQEGYIKTAIRDKNVRLITPLICDGIQLKMEKQRVERAEQLQTEEYKQMNEREKAIQAFIKAIGGTMDEK